MTIIAAIKKEIEKLKNSILWVHEPVCKAFIVGADDSPNVEEIKAYREVHPHTRVIVLFRMDCGSDSSE